MDPDGGSGSSRIDSRVSWRPANHSLVGLQNTSSPNAYLCLHCRAICFSFEMLWRCWKWISWAKWPTSPLCLDAASNAVYLISSQSLSRKSLMWKRWTDVTVCWAQKPSSQDFSQTKTLVQLYRLKVIFQFVCLCPLLYAVILFSVDLKMCFWFITLLLLLFPGVSSTCIAW